uniref:Apoptogenic protein 1, mitochondrial (inferred by orthology to a human protein) n=1 Tax=Strongyloides venezuelensis TaxID=75913 RepID=A0A0K0FFW4_STRVS
MEVSDNPRIRLDRRFDWVGPADRVSKIRPIKLRIVDNETELEKKYRLDREELNEWNSKFWENHNIAFEKQRDQFITARKKELGKLGNVTANDMSTFYKEFLNDEYAALSQYNKIWYKRNFQLLWPAFKVNIIRLCRLFRK